MNFTPVEGRRQEETTRCCGCSRCLTATCCVCGFLVEKCPFACGRVIPTCGRAVEKVAAASSDGLSGVAGGLGRVLAGLLDIVHLFGNAMVGKSQAIALRDTRSVDDQRLGSTLRAIRIRRDWTQDQLAAASQTSASVVSRVERGHLDGVSVPALRRLAKALDVRIDQVPRWHGADLDRLLNRRHAQLQESLSTHIRSIAGWTLRPEVSFSIFGERGVIDLLAWHATRSMLVVVEIKTELVDVMDLMSTMDRRRRLGPEIAAKLGWRPVAVSSLVILAEGRTNRRRLADHRTVLRSAFPDSGRKLRSWLLDPWEPVSMLTMWPNPRHMAARPTTPVQTRPRAGLVPGSRRDPRSPRS